jgi:hypothetical protein
MYSFLSNHPFFEPPDAIQDEPLMKMASMFKSCNLPDEPLCGRQDWGPVKFKSRK